MSEAQFDTWFGLNARGALFTVQKALPLFNDGGSILMTGSNASLGAFPAGASTPAARPSSRHGPASGSTSQRTAASASTSTPGQVATAKQEELFDEATKRQFESLIPRGQMGRSEEIATTAL
ncbi:SDR family oxidoreductase [Streptomyces griseofuscus]|uniref:SDR family oxidoreductase n=1 Tax=Streptomyces griseofuscus TaxID=146922 RepID=UPI0036A1A90B